MTPDDPIDGAAELAPEAFPVSSHPVVQIDGEPVTLVDDEETARAMREAEEGPETTAEPADAEPATREADSDRENWYRSQVAQAQAQAYKATEDSRVTQMQAAEVAGSTLDFQLRASLEALKHAREAGDTSQQVDLEQQIGGLKDQQNQLRQITERLKQPTPKPQGDANRPVAPGISARTPMAARYAEQNNWMRDQKFGPELSYFYAINNQLAAENISADDPRYYRELTQRVAKVFPNLPIKDLDGKTPRMIERTRGAPSRAPVASARGATAADARTRQNAPSKTLGPIAASMLKREGKYSPEDAKVQAIWAKIKRGQI